MAESGINHPKASVPFQLVEMARDLKEHECRSRNSILLILRVNYGVDITINTLDDWLYYRTRVCG